MDFSASATCGSGVVRLTNQQRYADACKAHLAWRKINRGSYDCATLVDGKPNKVCWGVWTRAQRRAALCEGAQ
jgi:GH24 family phage-related lysozyme (muramidase)